MDRPGNPRDLNSDILTLEVPSRDQALPAPGESGDTSENVTAASSTLDLHSDVLTPDLPSSDKSLPAPGESSDTSDKITAHSNTLDFHTTDLPSGDKTLPAPGDKDTQFYCTPLQLYQISFISCGVMILIELSLF